MYYFTMTHRITALFAFNQDCISSKKLQFFHFCLKEKMKIFVIL